MAGKNSHALDHLTAQEQIEHERDFAEWNASLESDIPPRDDAQWHRDERMRELELDSQDFDDYFAF